MKTRPPEHLTTTKAYTSVTGPLAITDSYSPYSLLTVSEEKVKAAESVQFMMSEDCIINEVSSSDIFNLGFPENECRTQSSFNLGFPENEHGTQPIFNLGFPENECGTQPPFFNIPQTQTMSQENFFNSNTFPPQNMAGWENMTGCYNYQFVPDPFGNIFNGPIFYPPDVYLPFFEPTTVVFKSQMDPTRKHSLPKIYSVDSITDDNPVAAKSDNSDNSGEQTKTNVPVSFGDEKESLIKEYLYKNTDEDLFHEHPSEERNKAELVQLKEKISTLFSMLKKNNMDDLDDIFETCPLKTAGADSPGSQKGKVKSIKTKTKEKNMKEKMFSKNMTGHELKNEYKEQQKPEVTGTKRDPSQNPRKIVKHESVIKQERLYKDFPMDFWDPSENDIIYDRRSLIELFKPNPKESLHAGSLPTQKSSFCLWPVMADYIYVSKGDGSENCDYVSSGNSIALAKSFEKSFYSLQMNKKYEQNQFYDGNLIVFDKSERNMVQNKGNSPDSLCNQSAVAYDDYQVIENRDVKPIHPHKNFDEITNREDMFLNNLMVHPDHGGIQAHQRRFAVHYADCTDSFMLSKNYKNEKINFFNLNNYDESHNWDSFISIMTSKVGHNTHINEQRMFRQIVKNVGGESFNSSMFGNVHTLTSSGGPFRLFDINGYPLTDNEGNVLKDPYGKCLIELDSTGFPKDDVEVFDAAGNSPKDVKFDPTQKPHTNCVVVKLTDNFKRPLHLFDKYGRPLTDCNGKLLVNIHGRPLLRFDNFGRPNTDYRGGPLYTDNGFRWSFKKQSLSKEHISEESVTPGKSNETTRTASICSDVTDENPKPCGGNHSPNRENLDKTAHLVPKKSDIWYQVENVLEQHSRKPKTGARTSKSKMLVNIAPLNPNSEEKQKADLTINHDEGARQAPSGSGENHQKVEMNTDKDEGKTTNIKVNNDGYNLLFDKKLNNDTIKDIPNVLSQKNKEYISNLCNQIIKNTLESGVMLKETIQQISDSSPKVDEKICPIGTTFSDFTDSYYTKYTNDILLNTDSPTGSAESNKKDPQIIKILEDVDSKFRMQDKLNTKFNQRGDITNKIYVKNYSENNSSSKSGAEREKTIKAQRHEDYYCKEILCCKNTNDKRLYTDSPTGSVESNKKDPQIIKILEEVDSKFRKKDNPKTKLNQRDGITDKIYVQSYSENNSGSKSGAEIEKTIKDHRHEDYYSKEMLKSSDVTEDTNTYIDVSRDGNNHYQINVKERLRTGFQAKGEEQVIDPETQSATNDYCLERDNKIIKHNMKIPEKEQIIQHVIYPTRVYHGEYCQHFKQEKNKIKDSPFRFPSEGNKNVKIEMQSNVDYVDARDWLGQDWRQINEKYEKGMHKEFVAKSNYASTKQEYLYPKIEKHSRRQGRDCNIVSLLGTPVKYVLNKLDTKLSLRQEGKHNKHKHQKPVYEQNDKNVKTLYSKGNKKYLTSTEVCTESKRSKKNSKKEDTLLAFKSKSFSATWVSNIGYMSYSGSLDQYKCSPESSSQYNKSSSDTVVMTRHRHDYPQRKSRRYEAKKPNREQYSFETHYVHTSNIKGHQHHRSDKNPRSHDKRSPKSQRDKPKQAKLFQKSGQTSKQKRTR